MKVLDQPIPVRVSSANLRDWTPGSHAYGAMVALDADYSRGPAVRAGRALVRLQRIRHGDGSWGDVLGNTMHIVDLEYLAYDDSPWV